MAWRVYLNTYDTDAELSSGSKSVVFSRPDPFALQYVRTWIGWIGDPASKLTSLTMKIHLDESGTKGDEVFASTTTWTTASLQAENVFLLDNGLMELYFQFNKVPISANVKYHAALEGASSGFTTSSTIGWKTSFPKPVYTGGFAQSFSNLPKFPFTFVAIGAEF